MPGELRTEYRKQVAELEDRVLAMGESAMVMLGDAMRALLDGDTETPGSVERAEMSLDEAFADTHQQLFLLLARQAPVAADLRFLTGLLHASIHVERMGGLALNLARLAATIAGVAGDPDLLAQLREMETHAQRVMHHSLGAFARRDADAALALPGLDEPLDRLNDGIFRRLVDLAATDRQQLDWALRMVLAARFLERFGDHAVDIGAQTVFIVTGKLADL